MRIEEKEGEKEKKKGEVLEILDDVRIPGTGIILEAGDKIEVLKDNIGGPDTHAGVGVELLYLGQAQREMINGSAQLCIRWN